ncbi:MAG: thioredoxin fold domain-containing protein [Candidatus Sedimenticola sp. (ex Thyasira tokunagai)]
MSLLLSWQAHSATETTPRGKVTGGIESEHPNWFKESFLELADDVEEAADEGKHVILFMHLNGCPYCYKMLEENFKHAPHTEFIKEHFDVIQINIKGDREVAVDTDTTVTEKELAGMLKVQYTPTILFLNTENKTVLRTNGYRSVPAFKHALDFVQQKAYERTTLAKFIGEQKPAKVYSFRDHPQLKKITNLQQAAANPMALLFEDQACDACDALHDGILKDPETRAILENFTFVRLDGDSNESIIDVDGNKTTPKEYARKLGLTYRPGIVLFDRNKEVIRMDGMLYTYHFQGVLRYVGERHYEKYPGEFYKYLGTLREKILASGKSIDISK